MGTALGVVTTVDAQDMPQEVEEYCDAHDISTHCGTEMYWIEDDGNAFSEWLKSLGYIFTDGSGWVGVFGT